MTTDTDDAAEIAAMSFEEAMRELEGVVAKLEHGEATLEESIALYERGAKLREHCEARLKDAEERVERITLRGGQPTGTVPAEGL
ncbi:exodeoxyribonuclease VII small subunit [Paracoccus sp. S-4012]|uniref:exodeoxyribonuclease VII small subunit n=1 Tax=Paracoccus sp. S-4012 TaxID=2665648 RepID=UPI0012AF835A|nr:exodeoxyribonuclease VII small subunit [Paracoccus sp. S-4012]MRX50952.1 exodeoxyribonuclease VII small subunit [Paracoccus sp. S-4012]